GDLPPAVALPDEIRMAISVEVSRTDHSPSRHARRPKVAEIISAQEDVSLSAAHVPNGGLPRQVVLPHEIRMAISVEVAYACHSPPGHAHCAHIAKPTPTLEHVSLS